MPAILKGWVDRVFTNRWAFEWSPEAGAQPRLNGLTVHVICTGGAKNESYFKHGYENAIQKIIGEGLFEYVGAKVESFHVFGDSETPEGIIEIMKKVLFFSYIKRYIMTTNAPEYTSKYSDEEKKLAEHLIGLEKKALDRWFKGDVSGYRALWSERSFTYFDAVVKERVEDFETINVFLESIDGKLFAEKYDFRSPRIQFGTDIAVLTYQLFAETNLIDMEYNVIEVFQKESDEWRVIHSTWSFIRPMDKKFPNLQNIV